MKCECSKVVYSVWQGLSILGKMEHSFSKNSVERENFIMSLIFESELYTWIKHGFNQRADFKKTLMSWQTILVGWLVLIQYQHAEDNEMGRQCPEATWTVRDLLLTSQAKPSRSLTPVVQLALWRVKAMAATPGLC